MKHFFILVNTYKDKDLQLTLQMQSYIEKKGGTCGYYITRGMENEADSICEEDLPKLVDLIFVIGGDGTLIRAARDTAFKNVPLIGVNLGTLGYLCELEESTVFQAIDQIMEGNFVLEARMRLSGHTTQNGNALKPQTALNDVVIYRSGVLQLVNLIVYVNGQYLNTFDGDGVIVSTPTGSTGYNLSAGGPIVDPKARMILITPISSHSLNSKSIVIGAEDEVTVEIGARSCDGNDQVIVSFDGDYQAKLHVGDRIVIHQAKKDCKILKLGKLSFLEILRKKMQSYQ